MYHWSNLVESSPLFGNLLIILSQFLFSLMFICEEQIFKRYKVSVEATVFWEGIWGMVLSGFALVVFSFVDSPLQSNLFDSCILICTNSKLLGAVLLTALCIGPFNYFGLTLTKQGSALKRSIICTARVVVVWSLSLLFGW